MAKFPYKTFAGLTIAVDKDDDEYVLTLEGNNIKELKRGSFGAVMAEANRVVAQYEKRAENEMVCAECNAIIFRRDEDEHKRSHP